jgi:hypothetical protein
MLIDVMGGRDGRAEGRGGQGPCLGLLHQEEKERAKKQQKEKEKKKKKIEQTN